MHISTGEDSFFLLFSTVAQFYTHNTRGLIKGLSIVTSRAKLLSQSIPDSDTQTVWEQER